MFYTLTGPKEQVYFITWDIFTIFQLHRDVIMNHGTCHTSIRPLCHTQYTYDILLYILYNDTTVHRVLSNKLF